MKTIVLLLGFLLSVNSFAQSRKVEAIINPIGNVESVEQVQVSFSEAMIKIGNKNDDLIPIESTCLTGGSGYWADEKTWVYTYSTPPAPSQTCTIKTKDDFKSVAGKKLSATTTEFKTMNAQIVAMLPNRYSNVDADQYFVVMLNGPLDPQWFTQNVYFTTKHYGDSIPAVILPDVEKNKVLENLKDRYSYVLKNEKYDKYTYVIKAIRPFPRGQSINLHWIKDFNYSVSDAFKVTFNCERETAQSACVPLSDMSLSFTDSISYSQAKKIYLLAPSGEKIFPSELKTMNPKNEISTLTFKGPFKENQKFRLFLNNLKSTAGEPLINADAFPLSVGTDSYPSLLKVERKFAVYEIDNATLAVTMRNVENPLPTTSYANAAPLKGSSAVLNYSQITEIFQLLKANTYEVPSNAAVKNRFPMKAFEYSTNKPKSKDLTEVVGIPLKGKGLHFHEFKSRILGEKLNYNKAEGLDYYVRSLSLVTDLNITLKHSPNSILVWVTSLSKGTPLKNVTISLYSEGGFKAKEAKTDNAGLAYFKMSQEDNTLLRGNFRYFYAFAQDKDDFSFLRSDDGEGLEKYRFGLNLPYEDPEFIYHAVIEKSLLRPNEILKAKLIYREVNDLGISIPTNDLDNKVRIIDSVTRKKYFVPVKWDKPTGTGTIEWKIPAEASLGRYSISLNDGSSEEDSNSSGEGDGDREYYSYEDKGLFGKFYVEEFKIPTISAQLRATESPWILKENPEVEFSARYFSGGGASFLPVKLRYSLSPESFTINDQDYADFSWQEGSVKEGLTKYDSEQTENTQPKLNQLDLKLDKSGIVQFKLQDLKYTNKPQRAVVSAEYKDGNGDIQSITRSYPLYTSPYIIGVKSLSWYTTAENFDFEAALLNLKQEPVTGKTITLTAYKVDYFSTRKKLLGGFYSYESFNEVKKIRDICTQKTNAQGKISCHVSDKTLSGEYVVVASHQDENSAVISSKVSTYVSGEDYWYGGSNSDRMDIIPFKRNYEPGQEAEFLVRGPITEGQLLVTVERRNIVTQFVTNFSSSNPTFKVKISEDWAPNIVISAILLRGRLDGKITAQLDLGKPSLKMGMTSIRVGNKKHILNVKVQTNKEIFQPREDVEAIIQVTDANDRPVNGEIAIAAVDEGLLALRSNTSWQLLEALLPLRAHSVETAYMISNVIGKRTLGLKALPTGGDGAGNASRELFDTSLFWDPKVKVVNGEAKVKFKTNDSLTSFKVVAIALSGADKFGTGGASIKVNKDIQSFSSLAIAARKGDSYFARFSIRNTTKNSVNLKAQLKVNKVTQPEQTLSLAAGVSSEVSWPITATEEGSQVFELTVTDTQTNKVADSLKVTQPVEPLWPMRTFGSTLKQSTQLSVEVMQTPDSTKAITQVNALPSLASELPGIKKFWELYPHSCFEQKLSRAISLNSKKDFDELMKVSELYLDANGLVKFYPQSTEGSVFLTNYVLQLTAIRKWKLNDNFQTRTLEAMDAFYDGRLHSYERFNQEYLRLLRFDVLDTLSLYDLSSASKFASLDHRQIELIPTNYLAHFISILLHTKDIPNGKKLLEQSIQVVKSRTVLSAGHLTIKDTITPDYWGMYLDDDVVFAKMLIQLLPRPEFQEDGGKLIISFMEQMKFGYWRGTMSNAWGTLALNAYKNQFEKEPVNGSIIWGLKETKKTVKISNKSVQEKFNLTGNNTFTADFTGTGKPWYSLLVLSDAAVTKDINHGISIEKTWKPIDVKDSSKKTVGDIWEIKLKITSKSDFQWLAVRDPIPSGAVVINEQAGINEKKALEFRIYEEWFESGDHEYVYQIRLNQPGQFKLPTTQAEAMYDSDLRGEKLNEGLLIEP